MHHERFVKARAIQLFRFGILNTNLTCLGNTSQKLVRRVGRKNHAFLGARLVAINGMHVAVEGRKCRMRQPCLVKMKDVHLAVELFLDHFIVIDNAVVRRLRDRHDARLGILILDQRILGDFLLDRFPIEFGTRNRSDDAVMVARGHQEHRDSSRQSNRVKNRLVAVTVHDHNVARRHRIVPDNLVGRGSTIGHKEKVVTPENASGILFRLCHRPSMVK